MSWAGSSSTFSSISASASNNVAVNWNSIDSAKTIRNAAAFLIVFALSMLFQFTATLFEALADIDENVEDDPAQDTGVEGLS